MKDELTLTPEFQTLLQERKIARSDLSIAQAKVTELTEASMTSGCRTETLESYRGIPSATRYTSGIANWPSDVRQSQLETEKSVAENESFCGSYHWGCWRSGALRGPQSPRYGRMSFSGAGSGLQGAFRESGLR